MKTYNHKAFLAPNSITSSSSYHAKVKEDGVAEFRVSDCNRSVRLHNDVNTTEGKAEMIEKLETLILGASELLKILTNEKESK